MSYADMANLPQAKFDAIPKDIVVKAMNAALKNRSEHMSFELFKPTLWSTRYINNTGKRLVYNKVVDTSWTIVGGKAMKINEIGDILVSDYTSTGVVFQDVPEAQKVFDVDQKKNLHFRLKMLIKHRWTWHLWTAQ